jgi:hypothetical protein
MLYRKFSIPNEKMVKSLIKDKDKFINQQCSENKKIIEKGEMSNEDTNLFKLNIERQLMDYKDSITHDSKKQSISNRINDREMISQRGCNPFLSQNDYINDLMNQEKYIRQNNNLNTLRE